MHRAESVDRLEREPFDVLVVGGGITGCGVALDAALRGLRVGLVEKQDFGWGTSSRSSKLIHGGLRYLRRLEVRFVREGLRERRHLLRMAPHLVRATRFLVPEIGRRHAAIRAGLMLYDVLAAGSGFPRHEHMSAAETQQLAFSTTRRSRRSSGPTATSGKRRFAITSPDPSSSFGRACS